MANTLRWRILGTGWIADLFVQDLQLTGHAVSGVGSRTQAAADRFASRLGIARAHGSYDSLLADSEVDIVYVATPYPMHAANAMEVSGGALLDLGIYPIAFPRDILGAPQEVMSMAQFKATGADADVATIFRHAGGAMSTSVSSSDNAGRNVATIQGTEARIEIDATWYAPTSFRILDGEDLEIERYVSEVPGRGMQTLDTIRAQIGLRYPGE